MNQESMLLIVDVQNGFVSNRETKAIIKPINKLIKKFKVEDTPIVCSRFINPEGGPWERLMDWHKLKKPEEIALHTSLDSGGIMTSDKDTYSAWNGRLLDICQEKHIKVVYICGIDTDQCVLETAVDIFEANITPVIIKDCCASSAGVKFHDGGILLLERLIGKAQLITSSELL